GSSTLAGRLTDSTACPRLPSVFVQSETENNLFSLPFTNNNGNYSLPATAGPWKVTIGSDSGLSLLRYVLLNGKLFADATSGSVSNLDFACAQASALIYGRVRDNLSNAIPGLQIKAQDGSYSYEAGALTD